MNASTLTSFQRCPRILKHQEAKSPKRWKPRELGEIHLRSGILALSIGVKASQVSKDIQASFLEQAANPGLDVECQPYKLAMDWVSILGNVFEYVSRGTLQKLKLGPSIILSPDLSWQCKSFQDEAGCLHRWLMLDRLDSDSLTRELHSWHTDGDRCAAQVPVTLHIIEVGRNSGDHQNSPWCRIFKHPHIINRYAFQKTDGTPLEGAWKAAWFADGNKNTAEMWVDLMLRDQVKAYHQIQVKQATAAQVAEFKRQVEIENQRMAALESTPWQQLPMFRPACDLPVCCYKNHCYAKST